MRLPFPWRKGEASPPNVKPGRSRGASHLGSAIAGAVVGRDSPDGKYVELWADVVVQTCPLELLIGSQNVVIFGPRSAGRSAIVRRLVNLMNGQYPATSNAAVYVDLSDVRPLGAASDQTPAEGFYRRLVLAPLTWMRLEAGLPADKALNRLEAELRSQVHVPMAKLDALNIRHTFQVWLTKLGVDHLSFFIDEVSVLPPDLAPQVLRLMLETFPRGGRVVLKLGARKDGLRLGDRSGRPGPIGLQINHDILVGLDLDEILAMPPTANGEAATGLDPKQLFLAQCIRQIVPAVANQLQAKSQLQWDVLFEPPYVWNELFRLCGSDVNWVGRSVEALLRQGTRFDEALIRRAVEQARHHDR